MHRLGLFVFVSAITTFGGASASAADGNPDSAVPHGLTSTDWSSIRAAYEANRHAAFPVGTEYHARNPAQRWKLRFDGRGFTASPDAGAWSWGLELVSFGREGAMRSVATPQCIDTQGSRVSYEWDDSLTEWFINDGRGLEHGFTVNQSPEGPGSEGRYVTLQVTLAVRGELRPRVSSDGHSVTFVDTTGAAVVNYSGLAVFDADGVTVPAGFAPSEELENSRIDRLVISVDDRNARYPLAIDPIAQQAYLKASNAAANDNFGADVAISGNTIVLAAPGEDSSATGVNGNQADNAAPSSGAVYVFVRDGANWTQQAYLKASNTGEDDGFNAVAISGDTIVVGAYLEDSRAAGVNGDQLDNQSMNAGAAYVFVRNGSTWSQQAYLKASNTDAFDFFGSNVAISGDTIAIGASLESSGATGINGDQLDNSVDSSGAVYIFVRSGTNWTQQAYIKASNTGSNDRFAAVALSGDTLAVGAIFEDSNATGVNGNQQDNSASNAGAAYVFVRNGTIWSQQAYIKASNTDVQDRFGSVVLSGDTLVVGAMFEDSNATGVNGDQTNNGASQSGAAYVYVRNGTTWSQQAYLKASNPAVEDRFGGPMDLSGNVLVIGSFWEDSSATGINGNQLDNSVTDSGAAYVFFRNAMTWTQQAYLKASNPGPNDAFGAAIAISGDTVVIAASLEDSAATGVNGNQSSNAATDSGAAYVFLIPPDSDGDGILHDNCPFIANPGQADTDSDGAGNPCDNCPDNANANQADFDADVVGDVCDNCPSQANADQGDIDGDGNGNVCDADIDGDGVGNNEDVCPAASACVSSSATGRPLSDLNHDCIVNGLDVAALLNCLLGNDTCSGVDPDGDGNSADVDASDDLAAFIADAIARPTVPCD